MAVTGRGRRGRGRRLAVRLAALGLAAVAVWAAGLVRFATQIPDTVADPDAVTDAIVVLTGGSGRLDTGLELLAAKRAPKLFVSGVYRGVDVTMLLDVSKRSPSDIECCIEIGHSAGDTAGNANETAAWMNDQGYGSLRLVTSSYHLARALLEFRLAMPDVTLVLHPVLAESVKQDRWWAWPGTASLIVGEFNKYLLVWPRHAAGRLFGRPADTARAP
ncbi:MAG: YdcF family protein [Rhodospirillales bacterium]|nr:YdcF family protein [Rhodospirillales bacterium]